MPLGAHRHITAYDRVIVGSDGSPSAMHAVHRAHEIAASAEARFGRGHRVRPGRPSRAKEPWWTVASGCTARRRQGTRAPDGGGPDLGSGFAQSSRTSSPPTRWRRC